MPFQLYGPYAHGTVATAAAYDGTVGSSIGVAQGAGTVIFKVCSGVCGLKIGAVGIQLTVAVTGATAPILGIYVRPTFGTDTPTPRTVGTITVPVTAVVGDVVYGVFSSDNISVNPGEEVIVKADTVGAALGSGFISMIAEPFLVGPTSGGSTSVPRTTTKPFGATKTGSIKLVTSGATAQ
jgi:hypothetical protein